MVEACEALTRTFVSGLAERWAAVQDPDLAARVLAALERPPDPGQRSYAREAIGTSAGLPALLRQVAAVVTADRPAGLQAALAERRPPLDGRDAALRRLFAAGLAAQPLLAGLVLDVVDRDQLRELSGMVDRLPAAGPGHRRARLRCTCAKPSQA
jgi:hypothetical protein